MASKGGIKRVSKQTLRAVYRDVQPAYEIAVESTPGRTMGVLHAAWLRLDPEQRLPIEEMDEAFQAFLGRMVHGEMPGPQIDPRPFMRWARETLQNPQTFAALDPIVAAWEQTWTGLDVEAPTLSKVQQMFVAARSGDDTSFLVLMDELMGQGYSRIRAAFMVFALVEMERELERARVNLRMNHFLIRPDEIPGLAERVGLLAEYADAWADNKSSAQYLGPSWWTPGNAGLTFDGMFDSKGRQERAPPSRHQLKMQLRVEVHTAGHKSYSGAPTSPSWNMTDVGGLREPDEAALLNLWHFVASGEKWEPGRPLMLSAYFYKQRHYGVFGNFRGEEHLSTPITQVENVGKADWEQGLVPGPLVGPPPGEGWIWGPAGYHLSQQRLWTRQFNTSTEWL